MWALSTNIPVYYPKGEEIQREIRNHSSAPLRAWKWNVLSLDFVFDSIEVYGLRDNSSVSEGLCIYCPGGIPKYSTRCLSSSFCINWYASDNWMFLMGCVYGWGRLWISIFPDFSWARILLSALSIHAPASRVLRDRDARWIWSIISSFSSLVCLFVIHSLAMRCLYSPWTRMYVPLLHPLRNHGID